MGLTAPLLPLKVLVGFLFCRVANKSGKLLYEVLNVLTAGHRPAEDDRGERYKNTGLLGYLLVVL